MVASRKKAEATERVAHASGGALGSPSPEQSAALADRARQGDGKLEVRRVATCGAVEAKADA